MAIQQYPEDWSEWGEWLSQGLHGRYRHRLAILLVGILFAQGRRTVATWLRAAGVTSDFRAYYYFISSVGRNASWIGWRLYIARLDRISNEFPLHVYVGPS